MGRKFADRTELIAWLDAQPIGATTVEVCERMGWNCREHTFRVLTGLRLQGLVCQHGRKNLARWCTPQTLPAVKQWHADCRAQAIEIDRKRRHSRREWPKTITPPSKIRRVRSVFELGETA